MVVQSHCRNLSAKNKLKDKLNGPQVPLNKKKKKSPIERHSKTKMGTSVRFNTAAHVCVNVQVRRPLVWSDCLHSVRKFRVC